MEYLYKSGLMEKDEWENLGLQDSEEPIHVQPGTAEDKAKQASQI